eukprot:2648935-Lingulodinium_polyedra.AAC.1
MMKPSRKEALAAFFTPKKRGVPLPEVETAQKKQKPVKKKPSAACSSHDDQTLPDTLAEYDEMADADA